MFKKILKTATVKHSAITTSATIINGTLGAVFYIILARFLGTSDFGLLTIAITTLTLIADIADLGTSTGLVRFVSHAIHDSREEAYKFLKLSLEIKALVWLVILIIGIRFAPQIALIFFNKPELTMSLRLVMIGVGGALFFSFATSALQAFQKFYKWSFVNIATNGVRLLLILFLLGVGQLHLINSLVVYLVLPFFGFFLSLLFLPTKGFLGVKNEWKISKDLFHYNVMVALFTLVAAFSSRLDTFLTARMLSISDVGIYGAANQLTTILPQLVSALGIVAAPKFASPTEFRAMMEYFKKLQWMVTGLGFLGLLVIPVANFLIPVIFGTAYIPTIPIFDVLYIAMLVFLISVPLHNSIFYYFSRPDIFVWVSIGHLIIIGVMGYFLILNYGLMGIALAVLFGMIFNLIAPLGWFLLRLKKGVLK